MEPFAERAEKKGRRKGRVRRSDTSPKSFLHHLAFRLDWPRKTEGKREARKRAVRCALALAGRPRKGRFSRP